MFIFADETADIKKAERLANELKIELVTDPSYKESKELMLFLDSDGLALRSGDLSMHGDLSTMLPRLKPNNLGSESLVKAAKIKSFTKRPLAIDATAGMGEDSLLLAAAGFEVLLFEANPYIAALLSDSVERAKIIPELTEIVSRMHVFSGDSITVLSDFPAFINRVDLTDLTVPTDSIDFILLDPMFPTRNKSGLIKKKFQLLQQLEMPCSNENELLAAAIAAKPKKIAIKRPAKGPVLAGHKPSYSINGKSIRYDCLVFPNN